jgi:hypothetical protein
MDVIVGVEIKAKALEIKKPRPAQCVLTIWLVLTASLAAIIHKSVHVQTPPSQESPPLS